MVSLLVADRLIHLDNPEVAVLPLPVMKLLACIIINRQQDDLRFDTIALTEAFLIIHERQKMQVGRSACHACLEEMGLPYGRNGSQDFRAAKMGGQ